MIIFVTFVFVILLTSGCTTGLAVRNQNKEKALEVATTWVKNESPTYTYDGKRLNHISTKAIDDCKFCYINHFTFISTHTGYGDRSDEYQDNFPMNHNIVITTERYNVTSALIDGEWDDLNSKVSPLKEKRILEKMRKENEKERLGKTEEKVLKRKFMCDLRKPNCPEYERKVCANNKKTYNNPCLACRDDDVSWYVEGACRRTSG